MSEITRFISREIYGDVAQFRLDAAAERGTKVHRCTEALDKYGEAEAGDDILPYIQAYIQFRRDYPCTWEEIEKAHVHPDGLYAGTLDRLGLVDGKRCILDVKTSAQIKKALYTAQLNLYRMTLPGVELDALYVLQLKKDGKYRLLELPIEDDLAAACITLHAATKKNGR